MPRPKLADNLKRDSKLNVYLTPIEERMVKEFSEQIGLPVALIVRIALLDYIHKQRGDNDGTRQKET